MPSDTQQATAEVDLSVLNIDSDTEFQDAPAFLGQQMTDEFAKGTYGAQYHVAVKPLEYSIGGKTGHFHTYFRVPTDLRKRSGLFIFIKAWKAAMGNKRPDGTPWPFGKGELVGTIGWWVRRDLEFGKNRDTGETIKIEGALILVKAATPEEAARASGGPVVTPAAPQYTDAELEAALDVVAGKSSMAAMKAVSKSDLSPELRNALLNGTAVKVLVDRGLAQVDGDGMVTRLAQPVAA